MDPLPPEVVMMEVVPPRSGHDGSGTPPEVVMMEVVPPRSGNGSGHGSVPGYPPEVVMEVDQGTPQKWS